MFNLHNPFSPDSPGVRTGAVGGLALMLVASITDKGEAIYQPYTLLVLALTAVLWLNRHLSREERFSMFVSGFMLASLMFYAYIVLWLSPSALGIPIYGHAWRIGFLLGIASILGLGATAITGVRSKKH